MRYNINMWKCPKCKREFKKTNQMHSCATYPLEKHFENKELIAKPLFDELVKAIEKNIGPVKIESLPCCIHFLGKYTFGAAWAMKDRLRIDFKIDRKIDDSRIFSESKVSANGYIYHLDIFDKSDIDSELIEWLKASYFLGEE